ncbi:MAG TPA: serine hydrolase domain-containing protein [Propionibacteriaceae bacterium]|jgi:CubicO group peptidase (beta-lactamase class C family)|nr:serine hydrolase domain-containing protein [Propionibacteriaceae bacterium]
MTLDTTSPETQPAGTGFWRAHRRILLVMGLIGGLLIGTLLGLTVGPNTPTLGGDSTGDPALVADVRSVLVNNRGLDTLSVGRIRDGKVTFAGLGTTGDGPPSPRTPYELGSVTKTFTGLLLADAVQRGEMAVEDPLSTHLTELAGTPAGDVTLFELATHSSGLPGLAPTGSAPLLAAVGNANPYDVSVAELIEATKTVELKNQGEYAYSNLGMSLLGHAEARAAGAADWPTLATERLLTPMVMTATSFAASETDIPDGAVRGRLENGWRAPYWYGQGYMPAGSSTWTTAEDMTKYAWAVLTRQAPGMAALEPEAEADNGQIGLAWQMTEFENRELTWHNGGTGGMRTVLALDRERQQGVIVLGNTSRWVDRTGLGLAATAGTPAAVDRPALPTLPSLVAVAVGLAFLINFVSSAPRGRDKLAVGIGLLSGVSGLLLLLGYGPWTFAPAWIWGTLTGAAAALAIYAVLRARDLPTRPAKRPVLGWINAAVSLIVLALVVYAL